MEVHRKPTVLHYISTFDFGSVLNISVKMDCFVLLFHNLLCFPMKLIIYGTKFCILYVPIVPSLCMYYLPVETSHKLRQVSYFDLLSDNAPNETSDAGYSEHLRQHFGAWCQHSQRGCDSSSYTNLHEIFTFIYLSYRVNK